MKIIKTSDFKRTNITAENEELAADLQANHAADVPVRTPSGDEEPEHDQVPEARLNRIRRNWHEGAFKAIARIIH